MAVLHGLNYDVIENNLQDCEEKFMRARVQIILLSERMKDLNVRYARAKEERHRSFMMHLRLRKSVLEGLLDVFMEYIDKKAKQMVGLRFSLTEAEDAYNDALVDEHFKSDDDGVMEIAT